MVCADSTVHPLVIYMSIGYFRTFKQTSSKTETNVLHRTHVSQTINVLHNALSEPLSALAMGDGIFHSLRAFFAE